MKRAALILVVVLVLLVGVAYFVGSNSDQDTNTDSQNKSDQNIRLTDTKQPSPTSSMTPSISPNNTKNEDNLSFQATIYQSPSNHFEFKYPQDWHLTESITDPSQNAGVFGNVQSAWNVSSFNPDNTPDRGGIPEGSTKIDFEVSIPKDGLEIETIAQCIDDANECEQVTINGAQYTRVYSEGGQLPSVLYISMNNDMMYRASALFQAQPGTEKLQDMIELFDEIAITFVQK